MSSLRAAGWSSTLHSTAPTSHVAAHSIVHGRPDVLDMSQWLACAWATLVPV